MSKRLETVRRGASTPLDAKKLLSEMQGRLETEMRERDQEAALFNTSMYETERLKSDWYVERRMFEARVEQMDRELRERDKLDSEIESLVGVVFERVRALERENEELRVAAAGGVPMGPPSELFGAAVPYGDEAASPSTAMRRSQPEFE